MWFHPFVFIQNVFSYDDALCNMGMILGVSFDTLVAA